MSPVSKIPTMAVRPEVKLLLGILLILSINKVSAQNSMSGSDTTYYRQKISEVEKELATEGIGNSRVYNLAAYHSILKETAAAISYLQMAVDSGLLILSAIADSDLENARTSSQWPAIHKKIIGNWYSYYPFGDAEYAVELIKMKTAYLRQRDLIERIREEHGDESDKYWDAIKEAGRIAEANGEKLDSLISLHGWPRQNLVGQAQARAAAFVLVYSNVKFQKEYVSEIEKSVEYNEIPGWYLATIIDKILIADGEKQLYGTQYLYNDSTKGFELAPIENEVEVDKRRMKLGMDSMEAYLKGQNVVGK